jgi:hypothetical protein
MTEALYGDWLANGIVVAGSTAAVAGCVLLHYEGLLFTSRRLSSRSGHRHVKVLYAIASVMALHVTEIWLFGLALWLLLLSPDNGALAPGALHMLDYIYFSAMTYTTVGFGDLVPRGAIRFLSGMEALTGFVLIAWSASFTYLEMERNWRAP